MTGTSPRVALVTGGSRGIGHAIVARLVHDGFLVAFTWRRDEAAAQEVEAEFAGVAKPFQLALEEAGRPDALMREVEAAMGPIAVLVNNAGERTPSLLALTSDARWNATLDSNLGGTFRCCRATLRGMVARRAGVIVNLGSLAATSGVPGEAAYAAAKAGIVALTQTLAREVGRFGIRVNAVVPGLVVTDMTRELPESGIAALRARECLPGGTPPEAVAGAVSFLVSESAAAITGQAIVVDAGASA